MLTVNNLCFSYRKREVLRDISFTVADGTCLAVAGPNGSGKSTLLSILAGVLSPGAGTVTAGGRRGYVPQGIALFGDMRVRDNLEFFAALTGAAIPRQLPLGVDAFADRRLETLSLGMQKRVSIACALLGDPELLLLDEPCAGLDLCYREELSELLRAQKRQGRTIVFAGHEPAEFEDLYDTLLLLGGETAELYDRERLTAGGDLLTFLSAAERRMVLR